MEVHTAQRLLTALACILSVTSILYPFLQASWAQANHPPASYGSENFWSLRHTIQGVWAFGVLNKERWLADFWSQAGRTSTFKPPFIEWAAPVFAIMFLTQIFTVLFGLLSIIKPKPILLLLPTILSAATIFSMSLITQALSDSYTKTIQAGYVLAIASTALFLAVFVWKVKSPKQLTP